MGAGISLLCSNHDINIDGKAVKLYSAKETPTITPYAVLKEARIYTPGQGILLEICVEPALQLTRFSTDICYGSWYDVEIVVALKNKSEPDYEVNYLHHGVYCASGNESYVDLQEIIKPRFRLNRNNPWTCSDCKHDNQTKIPICKNCSLHNLQSTFAWLSIIPVFGVPFGVCTTVLSVGKAKVTRLSADIFYAVLNTISSVLDIAFLPSFISSLYRIITRLCTEFGARTLLEFYRYIPVDRLIQEIKTDVSLISAYGWTSQKSRQRRHWQEMK